MSTFITAGNAAKFVFSKTDHQSTLADITVDYDIVIPRDGVYSASVTARVQYASVPTVGVVLFIIRVDNVDRVLGYAPLPTTSLEISIAISRDGLSMEADHLVTVFVVNNTDVTIEVGGNPADLNHLDVTYEAVPGIAVP